MGTIVLTPDAPTTVGKKLTKVTPVGGETYKFANNGDTRIIVVAKAVESKIKVVIQQKTDGILPVPREVACKEGQFEIGPFPPSIYNNEENQVEFTLSSITEIEVFITK